VLCLSVGTQFLKRAIDVVVSLIMIVLLTPVLLFTALAVRVTSLGPVVFRQQRVGLNLRGGKETTKDRRQESKTAIPDCQVTGVNESIAGPKPTTEIRSHFVSFERYGPTPKKTSLSSQQRATSA